MKSGRCYSKDGFPILDFNLDLTPAISSYYERIHVEKVRWCIYANFGDLKKKECY